MGSFKLALKNIMHKPLNALLGILLFTLGVGLVDFLIVMDHQLKEKFQKNLAEIDLVIGAKGSPLQMILSSMYHIDNPTGNISLESVKAFRNPKHPLISNTIPLSIGDSYNGFRIIGTEEKILETYKTELVDGAMWKEDFDVVIGSSVQKRLGLKLGDTFHSSHGFVMEDHTMHDDVSPFKVVGILGSSGSVLDQLILTNTSSIWAVHGIEGHDHGDGHDHEDEHDHDHDHADDGHAHDDLEAELPEELEITSLLVQFKNKKSYQALNMLRGINENTDLMAASPALELNRLYDMMGVGTDALRNLALIIALVSALSIFVSLFNSLKERKYELAIMRVMGGSQGKLFSLMSWEGLIIGILGTLSGILAAHIFMEVFAGVLEHKYKYPFTGLNFYKEEIVLVVVALLIAFLASVIPAIKASRIDIHNTLAKG